jgi:hypothetical protein
MTQNRRASSSGAADSSGPRSCPAGRSGSRANSTCCSPAGCSTPAAAPCGRSSASRRPDRHRSSRHATAAASRAARLSQPVRRDLDYDVRVDCRGHSVKPTASRRSSTWPQIAVGCGCDSHGRAVPEHDRVRPAVTVTDPGQVEEAARLRQELPATTTRCAGDWLERDVADYDGRFGLNEVSTGRPPRRRPARR